MIKFLKISKITIIIFSIIPILMILTAHKDQKPKNDHLQSIKHMQMKEMEIYWDENEKTNFYQVLAPFRLSLEENLSRFITASSCPVYARDYLIDIAGKKSYDFVEEHDINQKINLKIMSTKISTIITDGFSAQVKITKLPKNLNLLAVNDYNKKIILNTITFQQLREEVEKEYIPIVNKFCKESEYGKDYTICIEGHRPENRIYQIKRLRVNIISLDQSKVLEGYTSFFINLSEL